MVTAILLDLDNTIFDFDKAEAIALKKTLEYFGVEPSDEIAGKYHVINDKYWKMLENHQVTRDELRVQRFEEFFREIGLEVPGSMGTQVYEPLLGTGHYYVEHAEELLDKLVGKYDLYIASNGTSKTQWGRIGSAGLEKICKGIYISEDMGVNKPEKGFFDYIFNKENLKRDEVVIVGDSLSSDMQGGINAGIKTIWYNPRNKVTDKAVDYVISDLLEIPEILEKL